jgi:Lamin Tail Domain
LLPVCAQAQLKITEVQSSENSGSIDTAGDSAPDWFELSNFGSGSVNITGYTMDDNSDSFADSVALLGITSIAPSESVVFFENDGTSLTTQDFQNWWGPSLSVSVQIGTYGGKGVGLSSSGDEVNIFDSSGDPIDGVSFGAATTGTTFLFDDGAIGRSPTGLSADGVDGAFTASEDGDIGSPGYVAGLTLVPEPGAFALLGVSGTMLLGLRRFGNRRK